MTVSIAGRISVGTAQTLLLIAGPCQIESREHSFSIASFLTNLCEDFPVSFVFKSSFDKANRTSLTGARGIGIDEGLKVLAAVKKEFGCPVLTDIHSPEQAAIAAEVVDVLQIPAFLCRQTDLLIAAGATGKAVHVKKGQFLHPSDMQFAADKVASTGNKNVLLCERGTCHGYRDLVVDMRGLLLMKQTGYPVVFDATHSVQQMGGSGGSSGGARSFVQPLARAAIATGVDGLFFECHDNPDSAPSDGPCMLPLEQVRDFVSTICKIRSIVTEQ